MADVVTKTLPIMSVKDKVCYLQTTWRTFVRIGLPGLKTGLDIDTPNALREKENGEGAKCSSVQFRLCDVNEP